jgi:VCBS repeat-containing protein
MSHVRPPFAQALLRNLILLLLLVGAMAALLAGGPPTPGPLMPAARLGGSGYWLAGSGGAVHAFGAAQDFGGISNPPAPIATLAGTSSGKGYWLTTMTGEVFARGDAVAHGGLGGITLNKPIVGMAPTPSGQGYWLVASDGGVFAFGDAGFFGSMGGQPLNKPIVGMTPTASGKGYWFVASDGGLFAFGDARFFGSMGDKVLNKPVVGMAASRTGRGYRMVAADGGIFSFGDAGFYGSTGDRVLNQPIRSMAATPSGNGYWFVAADGGIFSFGDAVFSGSAVGRGQAIVGMAAANALPRSTDDAVVTDEDVAATIDVLANDQNLTDNPISLAVESGPSAGTASVEGDRIVYRPDSDTNGTDAFTYRVTDGDGDTATGRVSLTVRPVNDAPGISTFGTAGGGSGSLGIDEDSQGGVGFSVGDQETAAGSLTATASSNNQQLVPNANITVTGSGDERTMTFRPAANQNGTAIITVTVSDGQDSSSRTFTVDVRPVNDVPVVAGTTLSATEDQASASDGAVTATDADGDGITFTLKTGPAKGTATVDADGAVHYTPAANQYGDDSFTVSASDGQGGTATATVSVSIAAVNDAPVTSKAILTTDEDSRVDFTVEASDADGDTLTYAAGTFPAHGDLAMGGSIPNKMSYTPHGNWNGSESFTIEVSDGHGATTTSIVSVTVKAVNDSPQASGADLAVTEDQGTPASGQVTASDVDGDPLTYTAGAAATKGDVTISAAGAVSYQPHADQYGADRFSVIVSDGHATATATFTVEIAPVNDAPLGSDMELTTEEDTPGSATIVASDPDNDALTFTLGTEATMGSVVIDEDTGDVTYTPAANQSGEDSFTVVVTDGYGESDTAFVAVTINAVNDPPTVTGTDLTATEDQQAASTGSVSATDTEGDVVTFALGTGPAKGTATVHATTGAISYLPAADQNGADSFTVTASDPNGGVGTATVTVSITPVNDVPVANPDAITTAEDTAVTIAVLANDTALGDRPLTVRISSNPSKGTATVNADGTITYRPAAEASGSDGLGYSVTDTNSSGPGDSTASSVTVTISAVNDAPVANSASVTTAEDTAKGGQLTASDAENSTLTYSLVTQATRGTATVTATGGFAYAPDADWNGTDSFTFKASDGVNDSLPATVTVTITPVDDTPVAAADAGTTSEDTAVTVAVLANDSGLGDGVASVTIPTPPAAGAGTTFVNPDKTVTFTPAANWSGAVTFTYQVTDVDGQSSWAQLTVTVSPANDAPTLSTIANVTTDEDTASGAIALTLADVDTPAAALILSATADPALVERFDFSGTGTTRTLVITPKANANGSATITVTVSDGSLTDSKTFTLAVNPTEDPPTAPDQSFTATEDQVFTGALRGTDPDDDPLTFAIATGPAHGTISVQADGSFTYTPDANYTGPDSFTFTASDGIVTSTPGTAGITVTNVNDAPVAMNDPVTLDAFGGANFNVVDNDTDIDDAKVRLRVEVLTFPAHGLLSCSSNGQCSISLGAKGDSFTYKVTDASGATSNIGTVTFE